MAVAHLVFTIISVPWLKFYNTYTESLRCSDSGDGGGAAAASGTSRLQASSTVIFDSMGFRSTSEPTTPYISITYYESVKGQGYFHQSCFFLVFFCFFEKAHVVNNLWPASVNLAKHRVSHSS